MGLLEKMNSFLKKKPTKAEQERMDKKKVDGDRARMEDFRARIDAAGAFPARGRFSEEETAELRRYFYTTSECAKSISAVGFDVTGIDAKISGLITVLERAMKEGGSRETILRCFQGIGYGILNGHGTISENMDESDIVRRRVDGVDRYLRIAQQSFEIDQMKKDMDRKIDQKRQRELEFEETRKKLQAMIDEHPSVYYQVKEMTPTEMDTATGETKAMAGVMKRAIDLKKTINQTDLIIGQRNQNIYAVESANNSLFLQLQSWESEIDEQSIADIIRLGQEFERSLLKEQQMIGKLNDAYDAFDKAISYTLAGKKEKEWEIAVEREYSELLERMALDEARDEAGRQRYEAEQEALRLEAEKQAQEELGNETQSNGEMLYY